MIPILHLHVQLFKALADPIRLRIVLLLQAEGELCVCEIMAVLKLPQSTVSRHLAYLKRTAWVAARRDGVWIHYRLQDNCGDLRLELLDALHCHTADLPEAVADRAALAVFRTDGPTGECP